MVAAGGRGRESTASTVIIPTTQPIPEPLHNDPDVEIIGNEESVGGSAAGGSSGSALALSGSSLLTDVDFLRSVGPDTLLANFQPAADGTGFTCPVCSKTIRTRSGMRPHVNIHLGRYRYNCQHCGKGLSSITSLKEHLSSVHSEDGWRCHVCSQVFQSNKIMKEHILREHSATTNNT